MLYALFGLFIVFNRAVVILVLFRILLIKHQNYLVFHPKLKEDFY